MTFKPPELGRFYLPFVAVVVLLASFGGYYFFYVHHQEEYYSRRNLRELAVMAEQLQAQIGTYRTVLKNRVDYIQKWFSDNPQADREGYLKVLDCSREDLREGSDSQGTASLARIAQACLAKPYIDDRVPDLAYVDPRDDPPQEEVSLALQNGVFWLYLSAESDQNLGPAAAGKVRIHAKAKLSDLGPKFVPAGQFDNVLFVDAEGTVIFQSGHPELRATAVPEIVKQGRDTATGVIEEDFGGTAYKIFMQPVRLPLAMRADAEQPEEDTEAKAITEKGTNEEGDSSSSTRTSNGRHWVVCGLIEAERFRAETLAISYSVIIWFAFLLLMTVLVWPFLKLTVLAPAERLPRLEGIKLMLATLLGSAALTMCVSDVYYFGELKSQLDRRLETLATKIDAHLSVELHQIARQLEQYDKVRQREEFCGDPTHRSAGSLLQKADQEDTQFYPYLDMVFWADEQGRQVMKWSARGQPTTFISVREREYFSRVKEHRDSIRDLAVLTAPEGERQEDLPQGGRFWLDSIYSWTTGVNQAAFSTTVNEDPCSTKSGADYRLGAVMVAGVIRPQSLMEPVLPPGFGFALVDRAGDVLFHSDLTRVLIENFIAESDGNRELQAAIQGGIKDHIEIRYAGKDHRAYVQPLSQVEGLPWALIVFHEMSSLRTANLEVLTCTSFLFMLYLGFLLLAVYVVFAAAWRSPLWFFMPDSSVSFWPDRKRTAVYWQLVVLNIALIVLLGLWIMFAEGSYVAVAACLIPLYGCLLTLLAIRYGDRLRQSAQLWRWSVPLVAAAGFLWLLLVGAASWAAAVLLCLGLVLASLPLADERVWRKLEEWAAAQNLRSYLYALTLSFILVSVLPCIAFFKVAFVLERELMVNRAQVKLARALEARSERVRGQYSSVATSQLKSDFLKNRLNGDALDVYANTPDEQAEVSPCDPWIPCVQFGAVSPDKPPPDDRLRELFRAIRPLYDDFAGETWTLLHSSSLQPTRQEDELRLKHAYLGDHGVEITSLLPHMGLPLHPLAWLGWLLAAAAVYGGVRLIARNVFLMDIPVPAPSSARLDSSHQIGRNLFILGHPFSKKSEILKSHDELYVLDMAELGRGNKKLKSMELPPDKVIAMDQFEYGMDDPLWHRGKLRLLEELVYVRRKDEKVKNGSVLIVSSVDPVFYAATGGSGKPRNGDEPEDDLDRWTAVLSSFEILDYEDPPEPRIDPIAEKLVAKLAAPAEEHRGAQAPAEPTDPELLEPLRDLLKSECGGNIALRHIAAEIVDALPRGARLRRKQLADIIYDRCEAYYRSLWTSCSKAEKLTLIQLAEEGYVNRKNERVIRHLMRKGLMVRTPRLRSMNETFQRFVHAARGEQNVRQWEAEGGQQGWVVWRSVLIVVLVMLVGFLALTQREILESWIPVMGAFAGGVAGLIRMIMVFQGGSVPVVGTRS